MKFFTRWLSIGAVCALLIVGFFHPVTAFTQDLGRHILMGELIFKTHTVPQTNLLSYTYPNFPFINHHYLSEVLFYLLNTYLGTNGLLITMTGVVLLAFALIVQYSLQKTHILPVVMLSYLYLRVLFERTDLRPEMFGYVLVSIFIVTLYRYREHTTNHILWLIPLQLLWVQLHISFVIGLVILGLFFIDHLWLHRKNIRNHATTLLFITLVSATLITIINPNGIAGALYPLHIFQNYGYMIEENQNIFFLESLFAKPTIPYFKLCVLLLGISLCSYLKKTRPIDWMLAITFTILAASAVRNFPLFVFATFIPATTALNGLLRSLQKILPPLPYTRTLSYGMTFVLVCVVCAQIPPTIQARGFGVGVTTGAKHAADFYQQMKLSGPIFNNFDIGSYLAYRLYPAQKVFIDGRPEAYPASFFQQIYIPLQQNPTVFSQMEQTYGFNTIFFAHTDQTPWATTFLQSMLQNKTWTPVYLDHTVIIFSKHTPANQSVITKYGMTTTTLHATAPQTYSSNELLQLLSFYLSMQLAPQTTETAQAVLQKDPTNCQVLRLIVSSSTLDNPVSQLYLQRYASYCQ